MRIFSEQERRKKLKHAYKRTVETGKDYVTAAIHLMSPERQQEFAASLESDIPSLEGIILIMDETVREASNGRFTTWLELEKSLTATESPTLRLFNIGASLAGGRQLVEDTALAKELEPYIKKIQEKFGPNSILGLHLKVA